jgi:hypothetical protein
VSNKKNMLNTIVLIVLIALLVSAAPVFSQDKRVELNPFFGYTFSDGVTIDPLRVGREVFDTVDVKDGVSYGFHVGVFVTENAEVGFLWSRQESELAGDGTSAIDFTNMPVYNYHAVFTWNFGESDAPARPFIFGGLGATQYSPQDVGGVSFDGETQLSGTWGAGIKAYPDPRVGFSVMGRWTPTYIKSDPAGYWCGFYGCYLVSETQYSNQFELSGGVSFRF